MISNKSKQILYKLLASHLSFGTHSMNDIAQLLTDHGITSQSYGYSKLKNMLYDLPEFIYFIHDGDGEQSPLLRFEKWHMCEDHRKRKRAPSAQADDATSFDNRRKRANPSRTMTPPELLPVTRLEPKTMAVLLEKIAKAEAALPPLLEAAYQQAKATSRLMIQDGTLRFYMDFNNCSPQPLLLTFKRVQADDEGRYLSFQYVDDSGFPPATISSANLNNPARSLEQFAFLGNWEDFLNDLANLAIPEDWDFCGYHSPNRYILKKYIQYTFYRLQLEDKIAVSSDRRLAAFNTGLVDQHFDDIYACFVPNNAGSSPWLFKEFAIAGHRGIGKQLVHQFNPLPQPAVYFTKKEDLLFDLDKKLHCDYDHILIENIERFTLSFLERQFYDRPAALSITNDLKNTADPAVRNHLYERLEDLLEDDNTLYNRLKNRLDDATILARKQVRWNFKTAIPSYYPSRNTMNLMLPLHLTSPDTVDNVLVVELTPSGNYQGQTILTLEQAYIDARLVASPQANWLTTSSVVDCDFNED